MKQEQKIAIIGIVGVPARYGGFETLVENLLRFHSEKNLHSSITAWCSSVVHDPSCKRHYNSNLKYIPLGANGPQSLIYDALAMIHAAFTGHTRFLVLGVSGAFLFPIVKFFFKCRVITNIDGIEWKRDKWSTFAKLVLRILERLAVRYSDVVIADNQGIADYVQQKYGLACDVIPYGGDHAIDAVPDFAIVNKLPHLYALTLCRIEPENNIKMILESFLNMTGDLNLVIVGNWSSSAYGRGLRQKFESLERYHLLDPIYDPGQLKALRQGASCYVHGHSAGGTNPALVEMMHFGIPVLAHGCIFNKYTTEGKAIYFHSSEDLTKLLVDLSGDRAKSSLLGSRMRKIARCRYVWDDVAANYFHLLG